MWQRKKLSEETKQNHSEPHSLAVLFKVYLEGAIHTISTYLCVAIVWQKHRFLPSIDQLAMPTFFRQIYLCNGTNKRIKKKLEENLHVCTLN